MQYAPFAREVLLWDMFPQYQASAPLRQNEWNHVKVVISGRRMNVFVNGATSPTLAVGSLEGDTQEGQLDVVGPGAFANVKVTPDAVEGLAATAEPDPDSRRPTSGPALATRSVLGAAGWHGATRLPICPRRRPSGAG